MEPENSSKDGGGKGLKRSILLLLLSLFIHVGLMFVGQKWNQLTFPKQEPKPLAIQFRNPANEKKMQVVQQQKLKENQPENPDADFWSLQNQRVEKQTKAQLVDDFKNAQQQPLMPTPERTQPRETAKSKKTPLKRYNGKIPLHQTEKLVKDLFQAVDKEVMQRKPAAQASATDDYLKDVQTHHETQLNTREFKFYSYFERVREQLKQYWRPLIQEKFMEISFTQGRVPTAQGEKITRVAVKMDREGKITEIAVIKSSGVNMIDSAAVEAFKRAGAFPNPPQGMIESDGSVRLQWEFVLILNT